MDGAGSVPTGMASNPTAAPILFDRALLRARHRSRAAWRAGDVPARSRQGRPGRAVAGGDARLFRRCRNLDAGRVAAKAAGRSLPVDQPASISIDRKRCRLQPESLDLVVSALAFQFVNDLPGVLAQIRRALKPDGLLLAAMIGGDTLTELRQSFAAAEAECEGGVSPRVAAVRGSARYRRAAAARRPCTAGHRRRSRRGALRQRVCADGRSQADGRDQYPDRAAAYADPPRHHAADGADLRRTLFRCRRPHPRDLRCDLAVRLGAA